MSGFSRAYCYRCPPAPPPAHLQSSSRRSRRRRCATRSIACPWTRGRCRRRWCRWAGGWVSLAFFCRVCCQPCICFGDICANHCLCHPIAHICTCTPVPAAPAAAGHWRVARGGNARHAAQRPARGPRQRAGGVAPVSHRCCRH